MESTTASFTITVNEVILPPDCFSGTFADAEVEVGDSKTIQVEDYSSECTSASFEFLYNSGSLPSFMTAQSRSVVATPTIPEHVGSYNIEVQVTYDGQM